MNVQWEEGDQARQDQFNIFEITRQQLLKGLNM